ncbi:NUDIX domain-containing protein [Oscillatoria sp. CS-180]|uniref:NUDIX domain-containing protein n=1 Tax=Oscillatoria sp. CS-180 TaxID=3021720 RepID=UPI00232B2E42|nr:NUDIX domain-containing protein [Oscillatoria sp. CS-180]MDB9526215.1 NUDIX domain-containing protein [Oscillatoria sp. CS-180]
MAKQSAGLLMYRQSPKGLEILLVHPGGPFWKRRDLGVWTIPKGLVEPGEDLFVAACREFTEETSLTPQAPFLELPEIRQSSKRVKVWAFEGDCDPEKVYSNTFKMEWPPKSGKFQEFPEVDQARWFRFNKAKQYILKAQVPLLKNLQIELAKLRSSTDQETDSLSQA